MIGPYIIFKHDSSYQLQKKTDHLSGVSTFLILVLILLLLCIFIIIVIINSNTNEHPIFMVDHGMIQKDTNPKVCVIFPRPFPVQTPLTSLCNLLYIQLGNSPLTV